MFKRSPPKNLDSTDSASTTSTENRTGSTHRRTPVSRTTITSKSQTISRRKSKRYTLTKEDLDFIKLYSEHFPRVVHRVRPPSRFKRKRKASESELATRPQSGHTYELAEALCKLKERPLASGIQGQIHLIGALRRLDQDRECAWKCWMQCAMRREAEHINNMRISIINTRAQNLQDVGPDWYQQLSWKQMETVNNLEMALYQDIDESSTHRTQCLLRVLGIEPPPSPRVIKCVMKISKDDPCKFLIELFRAISLHGRLPGEEDSDEEAQAEDSDEEESKEKGSLKKYRTGFEYSLDERIILSSLAHLRIGNVLNRLNEEFGKPNTRLPYFKMVMPPCEKHRGKAGSASTWPYLQPLPIPEYNWLEPKLIQDAIYAQNLYMSLHRVPPPVPPKLRPVPYTHIQIPENLKPRRHKRRRRSATGNQDKDGAKTVMGTTSSRPHTTNETGTTKKRRSPKSTSGDDTISIDELSRLATYLGSKHVMNRVKQSGHRKRRRCRLSVVAKPRRRFFPTWLKKFAQSSRIGIEETSRPTTPLNSRPISSQNPHRNQKEECPCDCKRRKNNQVAKTGDRRISLSDGSDQSNKQIVKPLEVAKYLPRIANEPLTQLSNTQELPMIQKWIRMKNGLVYIHPFLAAKLARQRPRALWRILEGGRCSMIQPPKLCLNKLEERSLTWDHIGWIRREGNRVMEEFYRTCFEMQVALAREYYPSMATDYFRNRDKFLQIYYTYLPSRPQDCFRRPWQKSDFNHEIYTRWKRKFLELEAAKKQELGK